MYQNLYIFFSKIARATVGAAIAAPSAAHEFTTGF
jgi:hypothetical protein